jgi:hypothetical protein
VQRAILPVVILNEVKNLDRWIGKRRDPSATSQDDTFCESQADTTRRSTAQIYRKKLTENLYD